MAVVETVSQFTRRCFEKVTSTLATPKEYKAKSQPLDTQKRHAKRDIRFA